MDRRHTVSEGDAMKIWTTCWRVFLMLSVLAVDIDDVLKAIQTLIDWWSRIH